VQRCSSITRHAYEIVAEHHELASAIVCVSQRQMDDLNRRWKVPQETLHLIPNGVDLKRFDVRREPAVSGKLRLGYVGRLEDMDKGVLHLPAIIGALKLPSERWSLDIVGSGPDESVLRKRLYEWVESGQVKFHGAIGNDRVPQVLSRIDVLLLPSHWEGFPWSLVEGMAAGCVAVASRIKGVTDWILRDGELGMLASIGDERAFAAAIESLANDASRLAKFSAAARDEARTKYTLEAFGRAWKELFVSVAQRPVPPGRRSDVSQLQIVNHSSWRRFLPESLKGRLRGMLERLLAR